MSHIDRSKIPEVTDCIMQGRRPICIVWLTQRFSVGIEIDVTEIASVLDSMGYAKRIGIRWYRDYIETIHESPHGDLQLRYTGVRKIVLANITLVIQAENKRVHICKEFVSISIHR